VRGPWEGVGRRATAGTHRWRGSPTQSSRRRRGGPAAALRSRLAADRSWARQPALVSAGPLPAHSQRQPPLRAPALDPSSWSSCRCPRGWRLAMGQTIRPPRPGVRGVRGGARAESCGARDLRKEPRDRGVLAHSTRGPASHSRSSPGFAESKVRLFPHPLRLSCGPAPAPLERGKQWT
jgi:hypothetical protein